MDGWRPCAATPLPAEAAPCGETRAASPGPVTKRRRPRPALLPPVGSSPPLRGSPQSPRWIAFSPEEAGSGRGPAGQAGGPTGRRGGAARGGRGAAARRRGGSQPGYTPAPHASRHAGARPLAGLYLRQRPAAVQQRSQRSPGEAVSRGPAAA